MNKVEKGIEQGIEQGWRKGMRDMTKKQLKRGVSVEIVAEDTCLTLKEVEAIRACVRRIVKKRKNKLQ